MVIKRLASLMLSLALLLSLAVTAGAAKPANPTTDVRTNLVVFAYFTDTSDAEVSRMKSEAFRNEMVQMFGMSPSSTDATSFAGYLNTISYGQEQVKNVFPQDNGTVIEPVALSISQASIKGQFADYTVVSQIAAELGNIDFTKFGISSFDTFSVVLGTDEQGADSTVYPTVWPHQATLTGVNVGHVSISDINILNTDRLGSVLGGAGLIAHEYLHSLGFPDFYTETAYTPVGGWDIMANTSSFMQYPLAYARSHFGGWVTLDTISQTTSGKLTVHDQSNTSGNQAYVLLSPQNPTELFVVEYRAKGDSFATDETFLDAKIPGEGLIIYRVDTNVSKLSNKFGKTGVYVFRNTALGSVSDNSDDNTYFTAGQSFGSANLSTTTNALTFSDGSNSGIVIKNIQNEAGGMSFEVEIPDASSFDIWEDNAYPSNSASAISSLMINDVLHVATVEGTEIKLRSFDGATWTDLGSYNAQYVGIETGITSPVMVNSGNDIYYAFRGDASGRNLFIFKYDAVTKKFDEYYNIPNAANEFFDMTISQDNSNLFVSYYHSVEAKPLVHIIDSTSSAKIADVMISEITDINPFGQTEIAVIGNDVYAMYRDNNLHTFKINQTDFSYTPVSDSTTAIAVNSYDSLVYNDKLYVLAVEPATGSSALHIYNGSSWSTGSSFAKAIFDPSMTVIDGNLYALATDNIVGANNNLYTYRYTNNSWVQEGEAVEVISSKATVSPTLTKTSTGMMYASFLNNGVPRVKGKNVSVRLLSLKIDAPQKVNYVVGDNTDLTGLKVTANYSDGSSRVLAEGEYTIAGFDTIKSGEGRIATITFNGSAVNNTFGYNVYDTPMATYTVTAGAGTGGTITPSGTFLMTTGTSKTFTVTPNSGYEIHEVLVNAESVTLTNSKFTLSNITSSKNIVATFKKIGDTEPDPGVSPPVTDFDNSTTTSTVVVDSIATDGVASANVETANFDKAIMESLQTSYQLGVDTTKVELALNAQGVTNGFNVTVPLDGEMFTSFVYESKDSVLTITAGAFSVQLNKNNIIRLMEFATEKGGSEAVFQLIKADKSKLTPEQIAAAGDNTVYRMIITVNGEELKDLGALMLIEVPYVFATNEDPQGVKISYLAPDGTVTEHDTVADKLASVVKFTTDHLSEFLLTSTYVPPSPTDPNVPTSPTDPSVPSAAIAPLTGAVG